MLKGRETRGLQKLGHGQVEWDTKVAYFHMEMRMAVESCWAALCDKLLSRVTRDKRVLPPIAARFGMPYTDDCEETLSEKFPSR